MREIIVQLCEQLTGSRFLRGTAAVGGVAVDITKQSSAMLTQKLQLLRKDFEELVAITETNATVMNRLQTTGVLHKEVASDHGVVGVAARAAGIAADARIDYPYAAYAELPVKIAKHTTGDVYARYRVRTIETFGSIDLILRALHDIPEGPSRNNAPKELPKHSYAIGITEGWRGDIVYFVATDKQGNISRVGVRDPSFLNWPAVPYAVAGNIVPDFPLINKSFNLSYSGFDR
jgi:Ni,Fe-hydrogenase III large subunit